MTTGSTPRFALPEVASDACSPEARSAPSAPPLAPPDPPLRVGRAHARAPGSRPPRPRPCRDARGDRLDDLLLRRLVALVDADVAAEAQDGDAVGDLEDVVEVVRDEDDREPLLGRRLTSSSTCCVCATPSAAVGSSRITSFEFHITARATATDWRWPPESEATGCRID